MISCTRGHASHDPACPACRHVKAVALARPTQRPPKPRLPKGVPHCAPCVGLKAELRRVIDSGVLPARHSPRSAGHAGDGILTVGGGKYWPGVVVMCRLLREVGYAGPIECWFRSMHGETVSRDEVNGLKVGLRDLDGCDPSRRRKGGWEAKTRALSLTNLRRVLYLDADAYCVTDPTPLFSLLNIAPFVYWRDFDRQMQSIKWQALGLPDPGPARHLVQGGQLLIDLEAFGRELHIADWLNQHSDAYYPQERPASSWILYGDQDALAVSLHATSQRAACLGAADWSHPAFDCRFGGKSWVVHRCQGKLFNGQNVPTNPALPLEARVMELFHARRNEDAEAAFTRVYASGLWGRDIGEPHASGTGSRGHIAEAYLGVIVPLLRELGVSNVCDLGCGDGEVLLGLAAHMPAVKFTGVDVYGRHIDRLRDTTTPSSGVLWCRADIDRDRDSLQAADVALVKDVLQHWPSALVREWIAWARSSGRWRWLVLTNDRVQGTPDCDLGGHRGLDPTREPLASAGIARVIPYLHKAVCVIPCGT